MICELDEVFRGPASVQSRYLLLIGAEMEICRSSVFITRDFPHWPVSGGRPLE